MEGNRPGFQLRVVAALLFSDDIQLSFASASHSIASGTHEFFVAGKSSRPHLVLSGATISTGVQVNPWEDYFNDGRFAPSHPASRHVASLIKEFHERGLSGRDVHFVFNSHSSWDCSAVRTQFGLAAKSNSELEEVRDSCAAILEDLSPNVYSRGTIEKPFYAIGGWLDPDERVVTAEMDEDFAPLLGADLQGTLAFGVVSPRGELVEVLTGPTRGRWEPLQLGRTLA